MKAKMFLFSVAVCCASVIQAAPPEPAVKRPAPPPVVKRPVLPPPAPAVKRPVPPPVAKRPVPPPAPAVKRPVPPPVPVVSYQPVRNTYVIQLDLRNTILFEQRIVGMGELRDKIRMVSSDRPRPQIIIRVVNGVDEKRVRHAINLLHQAGFKDVKIERLKRHVRPAPPVRKVSPRMTRPAR